MSALPEALVARLVTSFSAERDAQRAGPMAAYMRDQFAFLGIASTRRRELSREVTAGLPVPTEDELAEIACRCWALEQREYQYFACDYVRRHVKRCSAAFLQVLRELVVAKSWWDTVDSLAHAVGALVLAHPELRAEMDRWIDDANLWVVRVALIHQLDMKGRTDTRRLFDYCERRSAETDFFVRKAIGWALRQHAKTDPAAVRAFVEDHGAALSNLSRREAMKGLPTKG